MKDQVLKKLPYCAAVENNTYQHDFDKINYSLSPKTVNARENFWNVCCFATNQMRDETAKDNRQTAEGISHDLI